MKRYGHRYHGCRVDEFLWRRHRLIVVENERIRIGILASKGADIVEFRYKPRDLDVLWKAPQTLLPGEYVPTAAREQGAFLDYYTGGWQEVFPIAGAASVVEGAHLGQHGEVALLPWDVTVKEDSPQRVELAFTVETVRTPFRLDRRMILESNTSFVRLEEQALNLGEQALPIAWGQHPVLGPPFLEEGCRVHLPSCRVETTSGRAQDIRVVPGKRACTEDVVVCSEFADAWCAVRNPKQDLAVSVVWDQKAFPYLWMWRVFGGSWGYPYFGREFCLGIEPFSCHPPLSAASSSHITGNFLQPGAVATAELEFGVFECDHDIKSVAFGGLLR